MLTIVSKLTASAHPAPDRARRAGRLTPWLAFGLWLSTMTCALGWFNGQQAIAWCRTPPATAVTVKIFRPIGATTPGAP